MNLDDQEKSDRVSAHLDRGWELAAQGDLQGALASAQQTLELNATSPDAYTLIGYVRALQGDVEGSLDHYRRAAELDENGVDALLSAAELLLHRLGEVDQAIEVLDEALQNCNSEEEEIDATALKVDALLHLGREDAAKKLAQSLPRDPVDDPNIAFTVGRVWFELGRVEESLRWFVAATANPDAHADAFYHLGLAHEALGQLDRAALAFLRVLDKDRQAPMVVWSKPRAEFEAILRHAMQSLPEEQARFLDGALVISADRPGYEVVADGADPRHPFILDDRRDQDPPVMRLFVYQHNLERFIVDPSSYAAELETVLHREIAAIMQDAQHVHAESLVVSE